MIRAMTTQEMRAALRQGAVRCIEKDTADWWRYEVLPQNGAFLKACDCEEPEGRGAACGPDHAAYFLMLCAEAQ